MTDKTYKLFTDSDEEYNLVPANQENIERICAVMCRRSDLQNHELAYYADLGGIEPDEVNGFEKKWNFPHRPLSKSTYMAALVPALFIDGRDVKLIDDKGKVTDRDRFKKLDFAVMRTAVDFFFASFGETLHDCAQYYQNQQESQALASLLSMMRSSQDGEKTNLEN